MHILSPNFGSSSLDFNNTIFFYFVKLITKFHLFKETRGEVANVHNHAKKKILLYEGHYKFKFWKVILFAMPEALFDTMAKKSNAS